MRLAQRWLAEAEEAMTIIHENYMQRGYELEAMALEAKAEFERTLASRGGR